MQDLNDKIDGGTLTAAEWNEVPSELQSVIEDTEQILSGADLNQLGKGVSMYAASGQFYDDSGVADAYVLGAIGGRQVPVAYVDGMLVRFRPGNANTGASTVTVGVLAAKSIFREDNSAVQANDLRTTRDAILRFDVSLDRFFILNASLTDPSAGGAVVTASPESSATAIPSAGTVASYAHGLGAMPSWVHVCLENVTPEFGYTANQRIPIYSDMFGSLSNDQPSHTVWFDATNVYFIRGVASGHSLDFQLADGSGSGAITTGNWRLRFRAFRAV